MATALPTVNRRVMFTASLGVILGFQKKPFLSPEEIAQARAFDAKQQAFHKRMEDHAQEKAAPDAVKLRDAYVRGESEALPLTDEEMRQRYYQICGHIREQMSEYARTSGIRAFAETILNRAVPVVEKLRARLEAQERKEADALELPFDQSGTLIAVHQAGELLQQRIRTLGQFDKASNGIAPLLRHFLAEFVDWDAPAPAAPVPSATAATVAGAVGDAGDDDDHGI